MKDTFWMNQMKQELRKVARQRLGTAVGSTSPSCSALQELWFLLLDRWLSCPVVLHKRTFFSRLTCTEQFPPTWTVDFGWYFRSVLNFEKLKWTVQLSFQKKKPLEAHLSGIFGNFWWDFWLASLHSRPTWQATCYFGASPGFQSGLPCCIVKGCCWLRNRNLRSHLVHRTSCEVLLIPAFDNLGQHFCFLCIWQDTRETFRYGLLVEVLLTKILFIHKHKSTISHSYICYGKPRKEVDL